MRRSSLHALAVSWSQAQGQQHLACVACSLEGSPIADALRELSGAARHAALCLLAIGQDHVLAVPPHTEGAPLCSLAASAEQLECMQHVLRDACSMC
jgi:hypothetical protein